MQPQSYDTTKPPPLERPLVGYRSTDDHIADQRHRAAWLAHVHAGNIGNNPPCPPEVAARRERNEAVLRRVLCRS